MKEIHIETIVMVPLLRESRGVFSLLPQAELEKGKEAQNLQPPWNPHAAQGMQEAQVQSLGWEDPLEEEMATHSSILAWKILKGQRILVG